MKEKIGYSLAVARSAKEWVTMKLTIQRSKTYLFVCFMRIRRKVEALLLGYDIAGVPTGCFYVRDTWYAKTAVAL